MVASEVALDGFNLRQHGGLAGSFKYETRKEGGKVGPSPHNDESSSSMGWWEGLRRRDERHLSCLMSIASLLYGKNTADMARERLHKGCETGRERNRCRHKHSSLGPDSRNSCHSCEAIVNEHGVHVCHANSQLRCALGPRTRGTKQRELKLHGRPDARGAAANAMPVSAVPLLLPIAAATLAPC